MRRMIVRLGIALTLLVTTLLPTVQPLAAQGVTPASIPLTKTRVSTAATKNEIPRLALSNSKVHIAWKSGASQARTAYTDRAEGGSSWPNQQLLGGTGNGSYFTSAVAISPVDDSVHMVWADGSERIYYSRLQSNGQWTDPVVVSTTRGFTHYPKLTINSQGHIWVIWAAEARAGGDSNIIFRYSTNNGASWQPGSEGLIDSNNAKRPWITTDRNGGIHATWYRGNGGVYYAYWNNGSWAIEGIPSGGYNADPTVTVDRNNNVHLAWRRNRGFGQWDIYYATKQIGAASWNIARLYQGGNIDRPVPIYADEQNNIHVAWFDPSEGADIWYSYKAANGGWLSPPINVSNDGLLNINTDLVARSDGSGTRAHIAYESWYGDSEADVRIEHVLAGTAAPAIGATPVIENGANLVGGKTQVQVGFSSVSGSPTQIRWRWGAAPTDSANDSNGWQTFSNPMNVPVPSGLSADQCPSYTLHTQVRNGSTVQSSSSTDSVTFDMGLQASYRAVNPFASGKATVFTPAGIAGVDLANSAGADGGDPNYTRAPLFYLEINGAAECSAVKDFLLGRDANTLGSPTVVQGNKYANVLAMPDAGNAQPGPNPLVVRIRDTAGNQVDLARTLIYDTGDPVLNASSPGTMSITSNPDATVLTRLDFTNINITDDRYQVAGTSRQFWGVWIANSRTAVADPLATNSGLTWTPVAVPNTAGTTFSINNWSLATNLNGSLGTGTYHVYVRFLDGAGNPTDGYLSQTLELSTVSLPKTFVPLLRR